MEKEKKKKMQVSFTESELLALKARAKSIHTTPSMFVRSAVNMDLKKNYPKVVLENSNNYVQLIQTLRDANVLFQQCYSFLNIITPMDDENDIADKIEGIQAKLNQIQERYLKDVEPMLKDLWLKSSSPLINQPKYQPTAVKTKKESEKSDD